MAEEVFKRTGPELKFRGRDALLAVITVGGMKDHGPHLSSGAELKLLDYYSKALRDRFIPYVLLTPGVMYSIGEGAIFGLAPEVLEGIVRDVALGVKALGLSRVMGLTCGKVELEALKKGFAAAQGIKKYAHGIWEFYSKVEALEGEDPLAKGGPFLTSQLMYVDSSHIKQDMLKYADPDFGIVGDPKKSTPQIGKLIVHGVTEALVSETDKIMRD